ncbi:MAG: hypothetical protein GYA62_11230 [Bacteroidales bacterium]|nr:hypothetical protein [Bacteroidales bacterium]
MVYINSVPFGLNIDELSQGYNAVSLLQNGRDRYGKFLPVLFKSYGSFQPPLYTYLTTIPVFIFGKSNFSIRFVSIMSQMLAIVLTYLIVNKVFSKNYRLSLLSAFIVAVAPWSIFFARYATEASLGFVLTLASIYLFILSIDKRKLLIWALALLALSTHAYYTERIVSFLILAGYLLVYRKILSQNRKYLVISLMVFMVILLPHLEVIKNGAFFRRFDQVSYLSQKSYQEFGGKYKKYPLGRIFYVSNEFLSQYAAYYSPKNLFFVPDSQQGRSIPNLSVYYSWLVMPYFLGFVFLFKKKISCDIKFLAWVMFTSIIPASLSADPFYTLRVMLFLWSIGIVVSCGLEYVYQKSNRKPVFWLIFSVLMMFSILDFARKYYVLFNSERFDNFEGLPRLIAQKAKDYGDKNILIDLSERNIQTGLEIAYYLDYSPVSFQKDFASLYRDNYYRSYDVEKSYVFGNIQAGPIKWDEIESKKLVIFGDKLSISNEQAKEHNLNLLDVINTESGNLVRIYETNPIIK